MSKAHLGRRISAVLAATILSVGVANAASITFFDSNLQVGDLGTFYGAGVSGTETSTGSFTISDSSISSLLGNVNSLPAGVTFTGISINGGASISSITPSLPNTPSQTQSISFLINGLSVGTYDLSISTTGTGFISGQVTRVPAPGTLALLGLGLVGLGMVRRKQQA